MKDDAKGAAHTITFTVDGRAVSTDDKHQTAAGVLELAGLDPTKYELAKLHGDGAPYPATHPIVIADGEEFLTVRISAQVA